MAPQPQNITTKPVTNTVKKPKDNRTRHVVVVKEAVQKADSTIPSTLSNPQHFIRISSKKSNVGEMNSGLCGDYASVITEFSDEISQEVAEVAEVLEVPDFEIKGRTLKLPSGNRRKSINRRRKTLAAVMKPPMPQPPWILEKKTSSFSDALLQRPKTSGGVAFEVQVGPQSSRPKRKPAMKKRRRATKKDLDAKQALAAERRKVCPSVLVFDTSCLHLFFGHFMDVLAETLSFAKIKE